MHGFWPIEEEPLPPGHVEVTRKVFAELALLSEKLQHGEISEEQHASAALAVCPELKLGMENRLVVRYPRRGCCF